MFQTLKAGVYENGQFNKQVVQKFLTELYYYLQNPSNTGKTKFHALMVNSLAYYIGIEISNSQR
jgi:hypothetical protein